MLVLKMPSKRRKERKSSEFVVRNREKKVREKKEKEKVEALRQAAMEILSSKMTPRLKKPSDFITVEVKSS